MNTITQKLSLKEKLGYGFGDLASVLYWQTFMAFLLFFYTDVFKITALAAGTMIFVTRTWDWVNDPIMGMIADRTSTRWGKFRPYLLWLAIPFALVGFLTFTTPEFGTSGKLVYAYITYTLLMMLYTAINIPYNSMLGVLTPNPIERTSLSSVKFVFAYVAGVLVSGTLLPMAKFLGGDGNPQRGWSLSFLIYGIAAIGFFMITFFSTKERVQPPKTQKTSIGKDLKDLFSNLPWLILLIVTITFILFVATRLSVAAHYFKYYVGEQSINILGKTKVFGFEIYVSAYHVVGQIASVIGVIFIKQIAVALGGKKRAFIIFFILAILSTASFIFFRPQDIYLMMIFQVIGSFTGGPLSALIWAMYADTADYSEWKNNRRATGLVFSASTMSQKIGWAIGAAFAGWLLYAYGFEADAVQNQSVLNGLKSLMSIIPAGIGIVSIILVLFYKLDEKTMSKIAQELEERRKISGETDEVKT